MTKVYLKRYCLLAAIDLCEEAGDSCAAAVARGTLHGNGGGRTPWGWDLELGRATLLHEVALAAAHLGIARIVARCRKQRARGGRYYTHALSPQEETTWRWRSGLAV